MTQWFKDGLESIVWNIVGNLMPLYVMVFISISENGFNCDSIYTALHQPFTYLILSGTYLTNSYYLISKSRIRNRTFPIIFGVALLFVGLLIKDKASLENMTANFYKELVVIILFVTSFLLYVCYEFKNYYQIYNSDLGKETAENYNNLETEFDDLP